MNACIGRTALRWIGPLVLAGALAGCGHHKTAMRNYPVAPAATGYVTTKKGSNGNLRVTVHVSNLAKPQALTPPKNAYVVWIEPRGQQPRNEGELRVGDKLNGQFTAPTTSRFFTVFVTAEDNPNAAAPSGDRVLEAAVEK